MNKSLLTALGLSLAVVFSAPMMIESTAAAASVAKHHTAKKPVCKATKKHHCVSHKKIKAKKKK